jgi:uncharacterized protein DUF6398
MVLRNPKTLVDTSHQLSRIKFAVQRKKTPRGQEPPRRDGVLDTEYGELQAKLAGRFARKHPSLLERGQVRVWLGAAFCSIGQVNFLFDLTQRPHFDG